MSKPDDISQDVWDAAENTLDTMLSNHGYEGWRADSIGTIAAAILAAKAEGAKQQRDYDVGHIMTVVESLMEGRMTDDGLTKKDHIEMQAQIEALEVVADEIQQLTRYVNTVSKNSVEG